MKTLVVFDLDDTLYKEREYVLSGRRAVARAIADEFPFDRKELYAIVRDDGFDALWTFLREKGADSWPVSRMVEHYRAHKPEISLAPEVRLALERLRSSGCTLAMITDGNHTRQHAKIEALGLYHYIDIENIYVSDCADTDKTTPVPFIWMEKRFPGFRRFYVGDNVNKDFHWPNLRGWSTVMLMDKEGCNIHSQDIKKVAPEFRATLTIDSLASMKV